MGLLRTTLLGTGAALASIAAASAADLPVRKAAPVEYVRVCDAYGAGFFFIPGTNTCLRIGGRVRADYAYVRPQSIYIPATALPIAAADPYYLEVGGYSAFLNAPGSILKPSSSAGQYDGAMHQLGWEARGRIDFDARTQTAWGTVQTAAGIRLARTTGVIGSGPSGAQSASASTTLEYAYVRFAGFTFGASRDNFAFMPSRMYGAGHWGSFANGAKQLAYTHSFGGGFSATLALQDPVDTTLGAYDYTWRTSKAKDSTGAELDDVLTFSSRSPNEVAKLPQLNANLQWTQGWGEVFVAGAVRRIEAASTTLGRYEADETAWAAGAGLRLNLPMIASGDALFLTAAYADGMTEYTTNWSSFKSSAYRRDVGGAQTNHPSFVYTNNGIETLRSWNVAALYDHFWNTQWRSSLMASYGQITAPGAARDCTAGLTTTTVMGNKLLTEGNGSLSTLANGCFGDATVWNVGFQTAWFPTRNFEIGVEVLYARTKFTMPVDGSGISSSNSYLGCLAGAGGGKTCSEGNVSGRLRVERTF